MPEQERSIRYFAPIALVAFGVAFFIIILTSLGGGDDGSDKSGERGSRTQTVKTTKTTKTTQETTEERAYVVEPGDNLATIAEETGISMAELEELNPDVDPRGLVAGQKLKLK